MGCEDYEPSRPVLAIASGYFDPLHVGHIEYLELAGRLSDRLAVIVNTDKQARIKKGYVFMPQNERIRVVKALKPVDDVMLSKDIDSSVCMSLIHLYHQYKNHKLIFCKGGDKFSYNIPEKQVCLDYGIDIVDKLGDKVQSSSDLVKRISSE